MAETRKAIHYDGSECYMPANRRCKNIRPEPEPRTDQAAQGEAGGEWECWTCAIQRHPQTSAIYLSHNAATCDCERVPLRIYPQGGWKARHVAAGHDIRRVEGKPRD